MHKDFIVLYCFLYTFSDNNCAIISSHHVSVLHVDTFKARAMFAPRSRAVKKIYGASLRRVQLIVNINHDHGCTLTVSYITLRVSTSFVLCRKKKENKLKSACSPQANRSSVLTNQSAHFYNCHQSISFIAPNSSLKKTLSEVSSPYIKISINTRNIKECSTGKRLQQRTISK